MTMRNIDRKINEEKQKLFKKEAFLITIHMQLSDIDSKLIRGTKEIETEADIQRCSVKKVLLEISQNSQGNTCASLFFN